MTIRGKLIIGLLCMSWLAAVTVQAGQQMQADPSTLVSTRDYPKWNKGYLDARFDVLSNFTYPFPGTGKKLSDRKVVPPAAVQKLDQKKVAIKGYMLPVEIDTNGVGVFILQANLQTCCFGVHGDPNTYIWVTMTKKTQFSFMNPVTVIRDFPCRRDCGRTAGRGHRKFLYGRSGDRHSYACLRQGR